MSPVWPVGVEVIGERPSRQHPENPDPDRSMENAVVPLVALPKDGLFHASFENSGCIRPNATTVNRSTCCSICHHSEVALATEARDLLTLTLASSFGL